MASRGRLILPSFRRFSRTDTHFDQGPISHFHRLTRARYRRKNSVVSDRLTHDLFQCIVCSIVLQCLGTRAEDWWVGIPADHSYTRKPYNTYAYTHIVYTHVTYSIYTIHAHIFPLGRYKHTTCARMYSYYITRRRILFKFFCWICIAQTYARTHARHFTWRTDTYRYAQKLVCQAMA